MLSQGYWLFEYMAVSKRILRSRKDYDLAYLYTEYDDLDLTYFIKYILLCVEDTLGDMIEYIKLQQKEQQKTKEVILKNPDLNLRQAIILESFTKNPTKPFTIKEISETYGTVYQTARTDLFLLEKKGLIGKKYLERLLYFFINLISFGTQIRDARTRNRTGISRRKTVLKTVRVPLSHPGVFIRKKATFKACWNVV